MSSSIRDDGPSPPPRSRSAKARYWCSAAARLPSARWTPISTRWALSRSGSSRTAARPASVASPKRPAAVRRWQKASSACARRAQPLALDLDPVLVPIGQKLSRPPERGHVGAAELGRRIEHAPRPGDDAADVDSDDGGQLEAATACLDEPQAQPSDAPERRAQASGRAPRSSRARASPRHSPAASVDRATPGRRGAAARAEAARDACLHTRARSCRAAGVKARRAASSLSAPEGSRPSSRAPSAARELESEMPQQRSGRLARQDVPPSSRRIGGAAPFVSTPVAGACQRGGDGVVTGW